MPDLENHYRNMNEMSHTEQLILAAYVCDVDRIKQLIAQPEFDKRLMEDIGFFENPFPLYYFTKLAKIVFADDYIDEVMPLVRQLRQSCKQLTSFWKEQFGIDIDALQIDYRLFSNHFFCRQEGEQSLEDFAEFSHIKARRIDYDLYEAAVHFDFEKTKELLLQGANPEFEFYTLDDIREKGTDKEWIDKVSILERIGDERSFLCTCEVFPIYEGYYNNNHIFHTEPSKADVGDLIGWAAHKEMYYLLTEKI